MNTPAQQNAAAPTDADCAEAAAWIAKLHSTERNPQLEAGLRRWLAESPAHRDAFDLANELWAGAERFPKSEMPLHELLNARPAPRWVPLAVAASVALAIVASFVAYRSYAAPTYTTDVGEQRTITLSDGSRIAMNTDTRLKVRYDEASRNIELVDGEALFDVAKDSNRPLTVIAGNRTIKALGTSFVVRYDEMQTSVTLVEGKVQVESRESKAERPDVLNPGERVTFVRTTKLAKIDTPELNRVTAWQRGQIILDHTTLSDAIAEMNRYSETQIALAPGSSHAEIPILVTGIFRAGDSEYFAQALAETHGLKATKSGSSILLSR